MDANQKKGKYIPVKLLITASNGKTFEAKSTKFTLNMEESIFDLPYTVGVLEFEEYADIMRTLPIVGEETLEFEFQILKDLPTIKKKFRIHKVKVQQRGEGQSLTLEFVSDEAFYDKNVMISRSFKNVSAGDIVKDLYEEVSFVTKTPIQVSRTSGSHHYVVPNLHPFEAIVALSSIAQHPDYEAGLFFFYQNMNGYNFMCLEDMFGRTPLGKFVQHRESDSAGGIQKHFGLKGLKAVNVVTDTFIAMDRGFYANRYVAYDPVVKSYKKTEFNYSKGGFERTKHLNKYPMNTLNDQFGSPDQRVSYVTSNSLRAKSNHVRKTGADLSHCNYVEDFAPLATSLLEQIFSKRYACTISGDDVPCIGEKKPRWFTCGEVIEIEKLVDSTDKDRKAQPDNYVVGKFLVSKCTHKFSSTGYEIDVEILSDTNAMAHEKGRSL